MLTTSPIKIALIALLLLVVLLPLGILWPLSSSIFLALFTLHLVLIVFASASSCFSLFRYARHCNWQLQVFFTITCLIVLAACIPSIVLPVTARDALIHHLAIPKLWIEHGNIYPTLWHPWSFYPMLIQLAFTALLQIGPEQYCSFYIFLFMPLLALVSSKLTYLLTEREPAPLISAGLIVLIPTILKLAGSPLVDLPLTFLCGAGIYYMSKLQIDNSKITNQVFAGIAWGLALSCKLNAIPAFGLALLIFGTGNLSITQKNKNVLKNYIIIILIALLCYLPWLVKNMIWTSNPFYPYLTSVFGQNVLKFDSGLSGLNALQQRIMLYGESALDVILLPIRIFVEGQDNNPRMFDGVLSPILLLGIIFGFLKFKNLKFRQLTFYSIAYVIFSLLSTGARVRYLVPVLPILVVLTAIALTTLQNKNKLSRIIATTFLVLQLIFTGLYVRNNSSISEAYAYAKGELSKDAYLDSQIPEYKIIQFCNLNLPKNAKISLIYSGNQFYLYKSEVVSSGHTSADQLIAWIKQSQNSKELAGHAKAFGLTHFIIHDARLSSVLETSLDPQQKAMLGDFASNYLSKLFAAGGFSLYELK